MQVSNGLKARRLDSERKKAPPPVKPAREQVSSMAPVGGFKPLPPRVTAEHAPDVLRPNVGQVGVGDYVVAEYTAASDKTAHVVMRVDHISKTQVNGTAVKDAHWKGKELQVNPGDLIANFGNEAPALKVGGVDLMDGFDAHKAPAGSHIGLAHWDFKPTDVVESLVARAFDDCYALLKKHSLHRLYELHGIIEITKRQSKYLGRVTGSKDLRKNPYRMRINPVHKSLENPYFESKKRSVYRYVVTHEFAHVLDFQVLAYDHRIKARWIDAFRRCNVGSHIDQDFLDRLKEMILQSSSMADMKATIKTELENDSLDLASFKEGMKIFNKALQATRSMSFRDLYALRAVENFEAFEDAFPLQEHCVVSNIRGAVGSTQGPVAPPTNYAMKNVHELFAEVFAVHLCGTDSQGVLEAHPFLKTLMEWTLQRALTMLPDLLHQLAFNESGPIILVTDSEV